MTIEEAILANKELVAKILESADVEVGPPMTADEFIEWLDKKYPTK